MRAGGQERLTVENLAVLELSDVAHADTVAVLGSTAGTDLPVVDGDALDDLDGGDGLLVLELILGRASRTLLEVLGELDLLVGLGLLLGLLLLRLLLLGLLNLLLLLLLLAELLVVLGDHGIEILLSGALLALLAGVDKLGGLLLILRGNLLNTGGAVELVELVAHVVGIVILATKGEVVILVVGLILIILAVLLVVLGDNEVTGEVNRVGTLDAEEDLLTLADGDVDGLLVVLWLGIQVSCENSTARVHRADGVSYALSVESADNVVLELEVIIAAAVALLIALLLVGLLGLGLALALLGLDILHLLIRLLLGSSHKLLDGSLLLGLLGLGGIAGATVGLIVGIAAAKERLEVLILLLVIIVVIVASSLDDLQGRAGESGDVALAVSLRSLGRVEGSHGDVNLEPIALAQSNP